MVEYPFKSFIFTFVPPMHLLTMTMLLHLLVYHNYQLSNSLAHMACIWYTAITYQKIKLPTSEVTIASLSNSSYLLVERTFTTKAKFIPNMVGSWLYE